MTNPTSTPTTALTVVQRAQLALQSVENEKKILDLVATTQTITTITNPDGYKQCHASRMALKNLRVEIEKIGKSAREAATAFSKGVIAEEDRLIALSEPEEERLQGMQDAWDAAREREKQARIEAERQRVAAIQERIDHIRQQPLDAVGESSTAIACRIRDLVALPVDATFAELKQQADGAKETALIRLRGALTAAERLEEEQRQLAAERVRIAEEERVAKIGRDAEAARQAEELRVQREGADRREAERVAAAKVENDRLIAERIESDRIEAERRAAAGSEQRRIDAERAQLKRDQEEFNARQEAERIATEEAKRPAPAPPAAANPWVEPEPSRPTDEAIIYTLMTTYNAARDTVISWLRSMDLMRATQQTRNAA